MNVFCTLYFLIVMDDFHSNYFMRNVFGYRLNISEALDEPNTQVPYEPPHFAGRITKLGRYIIEIAWYRFQQGITYSY